MFTSHRTVRFNEVDGANILFFSRVFEICHAAFEEALDASGHRLRDVLTSASWRMPLVHAEANFIAPIFLGDLLAIEVSISHVGTRSLTWAFVVKLDKDGSPRATATHVHVAVDRHSFKSVNLPSDLLLSLQNQDLID